MRPLDIAGMGNVIADFGEQLEIAHQEKKILEEKVAELEKEIEAIKLKQGKVL